MKTRKEIQKETINLRKKSVMNPRPLRRVTTNCINNLLDEIITFSVANRGTDSAFFSCYTYNSGESPAWVERAERILATLKAGRLIKS